MPNVSGAAHPKRQAYACANGHRWTKTNTRTVVERRFSKRKGEWVTYTCRQCRQCWRNTKRLAMRARRAKQSTNKV